MIRLLCLLLAASPLAAEPTKPDILLILADDLGWSDLGCYGSEIETPRLDSLAENGLRFTRFYNAARCCPTRASLLTGLYPHQAGMGDMVGTRPKPDGPYQGYLNQRCVTLAEVLKPAGYSTYLAGKWHVGEFRPAWPVDRGFDHHYGLISGAMNYFNIGKGKDPEIQRTFVDDETPLEPGGDDSDFYATDAFTDAALGYLEDQPADRPFFLYLAYTAPHWPLHAPDEVIAKYEAAYLADWQALREKRHRRQIELGLIPAGSQLSPPDATEWDSLDEDQRQTQARKMATYAAMVEEMDRNIGRVIDLLRDQGRLDNTLVMFLSDNGASAEIDMLGTNMRPDLTGPIGSEDSYHTPGQAWANVSNTPLRRYKEHTHEGGIRTPLIVHWPAGLKSGAGALTDAVGQVIDLMPTLREVAGAEYPGSYKGNPIQPEEGRSLVPVLSGESGEARELGWEHFGGAAWRDGDQKLVRSDGQADWELYDLATDPHELNDLAEEKPDETNRLAAAYDKWADRIGVR